MTYTLDPELGDRCTTHKSTFEGSYGEDTEGSWPICAEVDEGFEPEGDCVFESVDPFENSPLHDATVESVEAREQS